MGETAIPFKDLQSREYQGHKKKVHSVAWNCSGTKLASGSVDQTARVWQIEPHGHGKVKDVELKGHTDSVDQLCWDPKHSDLIATASGDKTVRLWDARSGKCSQQAELSGENINIKYKPDGTHVAVGNRDDELTILDVRKFKSIHKRKFNYEVFYHFSWAGYPVCSSIGYSSNSYINITDEKNPHKGVTVRISSSRHKYCSLYVSVICDWNGIQGPKSLKILGSCDFATEIMHPSGCPKVVYLHGRGWGWFGVFLIITGGVLGCYLIAGAAYRHFFLQVHGIHAIPNLEFWTGLPHKAQSLHTYVVQKFRGSSEVGRRTYNPIGF